MANFVVNNLINDGDVDVADMFPEQDTSALSDYINVALDSSFSYGLLSVHTYLFLFRASSRISLSIKKKLTEWNKTHDVKVVRYQVLADACASEMAGSTYSLSVNNAGLTISGTGVNTGGRTTVLNTFSMDNTKTPADIMVGDDLTRQVEYHRNHPVRISDEIIIGKDYGSCVLIQFTGYVDEDEFRGFIESEQTTSGGVVLPAYLIPPDADGTDRVFVGFMKDDTETDFANIIDAKYTVSIGGFCVINFKDES